MSQIRDNKNVRQAVFHSKALEAIREFPEDVRKEFGKAIRDLQYGHRLAMPLSRPMGSVGLGVEELRIKDRQGIYRAFYLVKHAGGVLVFHAFQKKTQKTPQQEIELGKKRLKECRHEEK